MTVYLAFMSFNQRFLNTRIAELKKVFHNEKEIRFTNDDSLRKMLYLASRKIVEHWTARCRNWDMVLAQLRLMFQDRQSA